MTATHATVDPQPGGGESPRRRYILQNMASRVQTVVSLWDGPAAGGNDYEILEDWAGPAGDQAPGAAMLLTFDGPISDVARRAHERAWVERIRPAVAGLPDAVGNLALWNPAQRSMVVVVLATSLPGLNAYGDAVFATTLLPDEDPALLPGPTRAEVNTVLS